MFTPYKRPKFITDNGFRGSKREVGPVAISSRFRLSMEDVFPYGAYLVAEVEPVRDFDKSTRELFVQQTDKESGLPVFAVTVLDADPQARKHQKTLTVKIAASYQPIPPEAAAGMPFASVAFDDLTVTPYVDSKTGRLAYSFRASALRAPNAGKSSGRGSSSAEAA